MSECESVSKCKHVWLCVNMCVSVNSECRHVGACEHV